LFRELGRGAFGKVWAGTAEDIMGPGSGTHHVALKVQIKCTTIFEFCYKEKQT